MNPERTNSASFALTHGPTCLQDTGMRSPIVEDAQVADLEDAASRLVDLQQSRHATAEPRSLAAVALTQRGAECASL